MQNCGHPFQKPQQNCTKQNKTKKQACELKGFMPVQVTRDVFEASRGRLKVVGRAGVGIDNVDLQAATESGCLVVNAPTANTIAAAEHAIALLTAMARNIAAADASLKAGTRFSFSPFSCMCGPLASF
jgi:phosphoglycerate dehydrogenase-like enzyme